MAKAASGHLFLYTMTPASGTTNQEVRKRLHTLLRHALSGEDGDRLAYNLADLHGAFLAAAERIEQLSTLDIRGPAADTRRLLSGLAGELYEHILPHLDATRTDLQPWISRLYDDADERGEL